MKRVLDESELAINDIPADVMECILMRVCLADWRNLSLVSKKFYNASRRKRCIQRWMWNIVDDSIFTTNWVGDITRAKLYDVKNIPLLPALVVMRLHDIDTPINSIVWPKLLSKLFIVGVNLDWDFPVQEHLPGSLKSLLIRSNNFNQPLDKLPPYLQQLEIDSASFNQRIVSLPSTLRMIKLRGIQAGVSLLQSLPAGLKILNVYSNAYIIDAKIPRGLKELHVLFPLPGTSVHFKRKIFTRMKFLRWGNIKITF